MADITKDEQFTPDPNLDPNDPNAVRTHNLSTGEKLPPGVQPAGVGPQPTADTQGQAGPDDPNTVTNHRRAGAYKDAGSTDANAGTTGGSNATGEQAPQQGQNQQGQGQGGSEPAQPSDHDPKYRNE